MSVRRYVILLLTPLLLSCAASEESRRILQQQQEKRFYEMQDRVVANIKASKQYIKEKHLQECEDVYKNSWRSLVRYDKRGKFFPGIANTCNFLEAPPLFAKKHAILVVYVAHVSHSQSKSKKRKQIRCPFSITDGHVKLHVGKPTNKAPITSICADVGRYHGATITREWR